MLDRQFAVSNAIGDKVKTHVDMLGALAAGLPTVVFEEDGALVVLIQDGITGGKSLMLQEVIGPKKGGHEVVDGDNLGLGRTARIHFLFCGNTVDCSLSEGETATGVTSHCRVYAMRTVDPPLG